MRRRTHSDFAEAWDAALGRRGVLVEAEVQERVGFWERVRGSAARRLSGGQPSTADDYIVPSPGSAPPSPPSPSEGRGAKREELLASTALGGQVRRSGPGRWNAAAEKLFFDELAATANVKRSAAAAGVSPAAVYARRIKRPDFRSKWDAVLETGRAAIEMKLVEAANKSFDPDDLDIGDVAGISPTVSVAEAIRIVQLHGSKAQRDAQQQALDEQAESMSADDVAQIRERLLNKLRRLRNREMPEMLAQGWSFDESHDHMIPPGWVRAPGVAG